MKDNHNLHQPIIYIFVGLATTVLNLAVYHFLLFCGLDYKIAHLAAIITAKLGAYLGNKFLVFRTRCATRRELFAEISKYILARGFTGVLDYFGLIVAVDYFGFDPIISKYVLEFLVILSNYFLGKLFVFTKKTQGVYNATNI